MSLVSIQTYLNRPSAEGARIALESEGIYVEVRADDAGGMRPELSMQKGVLLLVHEADALKAKQILQELERQFEQENQKGPDSAEASEGFLTKIKRWFQS